MIFQHYKSIKTQNSVIYFAFKGRIQNKYLLITTVQLTVVNLLNILYLASIVLKMLLNILLDISTFLLLIEFFNKYTLHPK